MRTRLALASLLLALVAPGCESPARRETAQREPARTPLAQHVEVNGTRLYCETHGRGDRAVVFLQGSQLPCAMWEGQARALAGDWKVIVYDVRGFGRSGPTGEPFAHENDLRALLDALEIERAALVGLSLGGRVAVEFAVEHPDRVDALVLVGSGLEGFPWPAEDLPWLVPLRAAIEKGDGAGAAEAWLASGFMAPAMENAELAPKVRALALANAGAWLQRDTEAPLDLPAIGRLATIRCPTLVLVGSRDVPKILEIADHLAREIPGARKAVIEGSGHVPNLERPEEFDRIVREFLASLR